ncbi:hypothetical protein ADILRU_1332 [Leifsonia rubra CMS 76R]|nr:hypothetical protein ADILRU_1332 [Leifsonia rubra CMS 76R]
MYLRPMLPPVFLFSPRVAKHVQLGSQPVQRSQQVQRSHPLSRNLRIAQSIGVALSGRRSAPVAIL